MIKIINDIAAYTGLIKKYHGDCRFFKQPETEESALENVTKHLSERDEITLCAFSDGQAVGIFTFLLIKEEKYAEMLLCVCDNAAAYEELFSYLSDNYKGYGFYFVFNPENVLLKEKLALHHAEFYEEQYKMVYTHKKTAVDTAEIKPLSPEYEAGYIEMHNKDMYWTGDKVIAARDRFKTFISAENGVLCGYVDFSYGKDENEIFDILVKEEYRNKGHGRKLLCKALEDNAPNGMILFVNVGNHAALHLYKSSGFETAAHQNSLTAYLPL